MLKQRGVEMVGRLNKANRRADFRRGIRLGKDDHSSVGTSRRRSVRWIGGRTTCCPTQSRCERARFRVEQPGFRTRFIVVVTTLLDPEQTTKEDLATLYRARWNNELDLRSIKITLQMDMLRCKTPELVRKEIWTHVLAYNLIRTLMAQAASQYGILPRSVSFKATLQVLEAFQPLIAYQAHRGLLHRESLYRHVLQAIAGPIRPTRANRSGIGTSRPAKPR